MSHPLTPEIVEKVKLLLESLSGQGVYLFSSMESMGEFAEEYCGMFRDEPYFLSYVYEKLEADEYETVDQIRNDVDKVLQRFESFVDAMMKALDERPDEFDFKTVQSIKVLSQLAEFTTAKVKHKVKKATYSEIEEYYFKLKKCALKMEESLKSRTEYISLDNIEDRLDSISDHGIPRKVDVYD